jgi:hypothetical protein
MGLHEPVDDLEKRHNDGRTIHRFGANTEHDERRRGDAFAEIGGEGEMAGVEDLLQYAGQLRLMEREMAGAKRGEPGQIDVNATD